MCPGSPSWPVAELGLEPGHQTPEHATNYCALQLLAMPRYYLRILLPHKNSSPSASLRLWDRGSCYMCSFVHSAAHSLNSASVHLPCAWRSIWYWGFLSEWDTILALQEISVSLGAQNDDLNYYTSFLNGFPPKGDHRIRYNEIYDKSTKRN